jgi:hypothetical protein
MLLRVIQDRCIPYPLATAWRDNWITNRIVTKTTCHALFYYHCHQVQIIETRPKHLLGHFFRLSFCCSKLKFCSVLSNTSPVLTQKFKYCKKVKLSTTGMQTLRKRGCIAPTQSWPWIYGVSGQLHSRAALYLRKRPPYPLYRRLSGPQSWSGHRG